jgi:hypothetical protein
MAVNFLCAMLLMRFREHGGSLSKAAFLSAREAWEAARKESREAEA